MTTASATGATAAAWSAAGAAGAICPSATGAFAYTGLGARDTTREPDSAKADVEGASASTASTASRSARKKGPGRGQGKLDLQSA
jgi:hypothetical protein